MTPREEEQLRDALRVLAGQAAAEQSSPALEALLRTKVRRRRWTRLGRRLGAAAVAIAALAVFTFQPPVNREPTPVVRLEPETPFLPLAGGDIFGPLDSGRVIRVRLPRSSMVWFGLPVAPEQLPGSVHADVLIADDGTARAVRFLRESRF